MKHKICALAIIFITIFSIFPPTAHAATFILNDSYLYRDFNFAAEGVAAGDTIIVTSAAEGVRLIGSSSTTYSNVTISIESSGNTKFSIENLNIAGGGSDNTTPIIVHGPNNQMEVVGTCNMTSQYDVGIQVESGDALTIKGTGTLVVRGTTNSGVREGGAGIGGRTRTSCGTINIVDCNVSAYGGIKASGIGGGGGYSELINPYPPAFNHHIGGAGGQVNISGNAVVYASGGSESADIGGGYKNGSHGSLSITGNAAVFFRQSQDALVSGFSYPGHYYVNSSYKFEYSVGGTPASSITIHKLMRINNSSYNASTGILSVSGESFTVGDEMDVSTLTITGESGYSHTLTSPDVTASSSTAFSVQLNSEDKLIINSILDKNGTSASEGTVYNLSAASGWNATQGADADSSNTITVSGVQAPTVSNAVYNKATGEMTVTGTNMVKKVGSSNDIDASMFTVQGVSGGTFTLTDTSDVEILSETSFKLILSLTDKSAVNNLLDALGTVSSLGDTYNLSAADNWNGAITGGDISDTSGNAIEVIYNAPTPEPTAVPTPTPTTAPTAKPTTAPRRTSSTTNTPAPTPSPTPQSSATQTPAPSGEATATPAPAISETPIPTPTQTPPAVITTDVVSTDDGKTVVNIDVTSLPQGTSAVKLPSGQVVPIDTAENGMLTIEVFDGWNNEDGSITLVMLNDDEVALGSYNIEAPSVETSRNMPVWIIIVLVGVMAIVWGVVIYSRKVA